MSYHSVASDNPATAHFPLERLARRAARAGLILASLVLLAGCGHSDNAAIRLFNVSQDYTDINRLPTSGDASIRLVHAISGLTDAISLSVNYVPVVTDVSPGEASSYNTGIAATTTGALAVTDTPTSQQLYSQSPVALASQGVYTLFMFGSASSPNGVLNQDR